MHPCEANWNIGDKLGTGGQGTTYRVTRKCDATQVAVLKKLKNQGSDQARNRMAREVIGLDAAALTLAKTPKVLEHNTQDYRNKSIELYLVMELIAGTALSERIDKHGPLTIDDGLIVAQGIAETIAECHRVSLYHRDLKPANIVLRDDRYEEPVVVDFGLSFNALDSPDDTLTDEKMANKFLDLPETNTPEGDRRDPRIDVTACVGVLYYLLFGKRPGQLIGADGRPPHRRAGIRLEQCIPIDTQRREVELIFDRGFAANSADRFQTIDELIERLRRVTHSSHHGEVADPIAVALRLTNVLHAHDRPTQLARFRTTGAAITECLHNCINHYSTKLGVFRVSQLNGNARFQMPGGIDDVGAVSLQIVLWADQHTKRVIGFYKLGARGQECVLLRWTTQLDQPPRGQVMFSELAPDEVAIYSGDETPPVAEIRQEFDTWLAKGLEKLGSSICL